MPVAHALLVTACYVCTTPAQEDYRLLCSRGCQPLDAYKKCNLGEAPATALVGRVDWKTSNAGRDVISLFNGNDQLLGKSECGGCRHRRVPAGP
eukprot:scaffold25482_cov17-Tisochrysis_lutea.AAC.2